MPVFTYVELENTDNEKMRFQATLSMNQLEIGRGYGANKKQAKMIAAKMALIGMAPNVYNEWAQSPGRIEALNRQNRNGEEVVMKEKSQFANLDKSSSPNNDDYSEKSAPGTPLIHGSGSKRSCSEF